ncbi:MAG: asparaginase [Trueperaceae bacterium]|nr:asparaginase [Trueperaceae bacterium]
MTKKVLLAHTGGTIGMRRGERGYAPSAGYLAELLARMPELSDPSLPAIELVEFAPLLDSADMVPSDWSRIAAEIARRYEEVDGVVVLHGTDTMAFTASALSFMLEGLAKPVIVTGSQVPLAELRSDARENLIASLQIAAMPGLHEVCVYFSGRLLRGNRATKVSASGFDAFDSPNEAPLATVGVEVELRQGAARPALPGRLSVRELRDVTVAAVRLFPGVSARFMAHVLQAPLEGLVLETYGAGNAPTRDPRLLDELAAAATRGVVVVNTTQCLRGRVDMRGYATGRALAEAGVTGGADMTPEAALTKLIYLLGSGMTPDAARAAMARDLRGELTE